MTAEQIRHARDLLTRPDNTVSSIARLLGAARATIYKYVCRARTRTMALGWYFLCSSGRSPVLADQAVDDLPARDPAGHVDRLAGFM